jgi:DNA-binding NtrC family response regulator
LSEKILFVDDEANILDTFRRGLRKRFTLETALGAQAVLHALQHSGPFAVVVSDLKMPKMDGIQFLSQVRELSPAPCASCSRATPTWRRPSPR